MANNKNKDKDKDKDKKPKHEQPYNKIKIKLDKIKDMYPKTWQKRCGFVTGITDREGRKKGLYKMLFPDIETGRSSQIFKK